LSEAVFKEIISMVLFCAFIRLDVAIHRNKKRTQFTKKPLNPEKIQSGSLLSGKKENL